MSKQTYTYGTTPEEEIRKRLPHKYQMRFSENDMIHLLNLLNRASFLESTGDKKEDEWPMDMRTFILGTIGIEEI